MTFFQRKRAAVDGAANLSSGNSGTTATSGAMEAASASVQHRLAMIPQDDQPFGRPFPAKLSEGIGGLNVAAGESELGLPSADALQQLKRALHARLLLAIDVAQVSKLSQEALTEQVRLQTLDLLLEEEVALTERLRDRLVAAVVSEIVGLGPLEPLLRDPGVTEIMVNGATDIFVERDGRLTRTDAVFTDDQHVYRIIERIVAPMGRRIDETSPMVDCRLPDGARVNAIIPPLSVKGPCLTIRKFSQVPFVADDLIHFGTLTMQMASFLRACVIGRLNIMVSGGTGSGKTTMLNILSSFIPDDERIITIEDAAELQLQQAHVVTLESRPANLEGSGEITIRQLVRNALRMRPDRIVVGEARGGEALDMLQAMNTGHDGSLTTIHANSPRDAISRVETLALMAGTELPIRAIREQIAAALDLIIQQSRMRDGSRKITRITEVQSMDGDVIVLQDIFRYDQRGIDEDGRVIGSFMPTGLRPNFATTLDMEGIPMPPELFL